MFMWLIQIMTATVETVSEQLDLASIMPAEKVVSAVARAVTLTDTDTATATVQVAKPNLVGENDQPVEPGPDDDLSNFWHTSVGKFRFSIEELPQQLQYIHQLLQVKFDHLIIYLFELVVILIFLFIHRKYRLQIDQICFITCCNVFIFWYCMEMRLQKLLKNTEDFSFGARRIY